MLRGSVSQTVSRSAALRAPRVLPRRAGHVFLSVALAASLACMTPASAFASDSDEETIASWLDAAGAELDDPNYQPYSYATAYDDAAACSVAAREASELPVKFDLRDPNDDGDRSDSVVTPVKMQNPWGTCWGFATIAACETSILSELGKTSAETGLDLSELQLAGSVYRIDGAPERFVGAAQAGEGYHNSSKNTNAGLDSGGYATFGSSVFAAGIGPLSEEEVPYKNAEGLKHCNVFGGGDFSVRALTDKQIADLRIAGFVVIEQYWAGNYTEDGETMTYTDWSVPEDVWNVSEYELESGNILPSTKVYDSETFSYKLDPRGVEAVKSEMYDYGRGVTVICNVSDHVNKQNWAAYTTSANGNHMVTIVGWDDSYPKENFANDTGKLPEGDGAWLIKNSWGSGTESFPNSQISPWGIVEDGVSTGYCWLSYYDASIDAMESFDFDVNSYGDEDEYYIDQYDYLPDRFTTTRSSEKPISSANIYTAKGDMALRTLGAATYKPNSSVTYQVYLLDDEATTPTDPGHSELVYSVDDIYRYGGYHRITLPESDWIAMREGQRYAVVTTQKCNDDGLYYQGVATNNGKPTEASVDLYRENVRTQKEKTYYDPEYQRTYSSCIAEGMSVEEAIAKAKEAAEKKVEEAKAIIDSLVEDAVDAYANRYFVAKVNAGESWTSASRGDWTFDSSDSSDQTQWTDWSLIAQTLEEKNTQAVDNLSVKAFSEIRSWASVDELDSLASAIKAAKAKLAAATVSEDGSDVPTSGTWMTQAEYDAAAAAVASAEAVLAAAGDYHESLANTTPSPDGVASAAAALAFETHAGSKADGGKDDPTPEPEPEPAPQPEQDSDAGAKADPEPAPTKAAASTAGAGAAGKASPATGDGARDAAGLALIAGLFAIAGAAVGKGRSATKRQSGRER